jgi:hypothetical protein
VEGDSLFEVLLPGFVSLVTACSSYHIMETGLASAPTEMKSRAEGHAYGPSFKFLNSVLSSGRMVCYIYTADACSMVRRNGSGESSVLERVESERP